MVCGEIVSERFWQQKLVMVWDNRVINDDIGSNSPGAPLLHDSRLRPACSSQHCSNQLCGAHWKSTSPFTIFRDESNYKNSHQHHYGKMTRIEVKDPERHCWYFCRIADCIISSLVVLHDHCRVPGCRPEPGGLPPTQHGAWPAESPDIPSKQTEGEC